MQRSCGFAYRNTKVVFAKRAHYQHGNTTVSVCFATGWTISSAMISLVRYVQFCVKNKWKKHVGTKNCSLITLEKRSLAFHRFGMLLYSAQSFLELLHLSLIFFSPIPECLSGRIEVWRNASFAFVNFQEFVEHFAIFLLRKPLQDMWTIFSEW